jgi:hypothetical protein
MEVHPLMEYPHWKCGMNGYMDEIIYGSSRDAHPTEMGVVDHRWQALSRLPITHCIFSYQFNHLVS